MALAALVLAAGGAAAAPVPFGHAGASEIGATERSRIERIARRAGFAEVERIRREGERVVVVTGVDADGAAFRIALDADGDVIGRERLGWARVEFVPPPGGR